MNKPLILLAEDNEGDVVLVNEALRSCLSAYTLKVVKNGDEADALLGRLAGEGKSNCPNIFLMDLNLPRTDAFKMLSQFREHCGRDVPVVVVSSSYAPADMAKAYELGARRFFHKPTDLDEFLKLGPLVQEVLENNSTPRG